ncbi:MAG: hypothetical protein J1F32_00670 [Erysipelotrichales bacterium]|nr:hypothetical protein [Erysipelotrichales bacterium]
MEFRIFRKDANLKTWQKVIIILYIILAFLLLFFGPAGLFLILWRIDINERHWTDEQYTLLVGYAEQRFDEMKDIVYGYNGKVTEIYHEINYQHHKGVHQDRLYFQIYEFECYVSILLNFDKNENVRVYEGVLDLDGQGYDTLEECEFISEKYAFVMDFIDYIDEYIPAKEYVDMVQIEESLLAAKEMHNDPEVIDHSVFNHLTDEANGIYYYGSFHCWTNKSNQYYYSFWLKFDRFWDSK